MRVLIPDPLLVGGSLRGLQDRQGNPSGLYSGGAPIGVCTFSATKLACPRSKKWSDIALISLTAILDRPKSATGCSLAKAVERSYGPRSPVFSPWPRPGPSVAPTWCVAPVLFGRSSHPPRQYASGVGYLRLCAARMAQNMHTPMGSAPLPGVAEGVPLLLIPKDTLLS